MNVFINLISLYNHLPVSSTYRAVIQGILENLDQMKNATIFDVAEITAASRATVWRMVKLMGYRSYREFHHELQKVLSQYSYYNWGLSQRKPDPGQSISGMAVEMLQESAILVSNLFSGTLPEQIAAILHSADRVSFYDLPDSSTYFLVQNLAMAGKRIGQFNLFPEMLNDTDSLTADSVIFSAPLEFPDMLDMSPIFARAKAQGATVVLGTDMQSKYKQYGDIFLFPTDLHLKYPAAKKQAYHTLFVIVSDIFRQRYMPPTAHTPEKHSTQGV